MILLLIIIITIKTLHTWCYIISYTNDFQTESARNFSEGNVQRKPKKRITKNKQVNE